MKDKTVTYAGREWCHQQMYGLIATLIEKGFLITIEKDSGSLMVAVCIRGSFFVKTGKSATIWIALVGAVEKMEAE